MNARRLRNCCNCLTRNSTDCSPAAAPPAAARSGGLSGASRKAGRTDRAAPDTDAASRRKATRTGQAPPRNATRIELAPSRVAAVSMTAVYVLALAAAGLWQAAIAAKAAVALAVLVHAALHCRRAARRPRTVVLGVEAGRGVVACNGAPVAAFRVEHLFCYYLQMSIQFSDGRSCKLCIFGDRAGPQDFRRLCLCAADYRRAGWIQTTPAEL